MSGEFNPSEYAIALLAGGRSDEREISLAGGESAKEALEKAGFAVTQLDPASKDDLKTLVDGGFDAAFLCTHGRFGEDGCLQGFLELLDLPYTGPGVWSSATAMDKSRSKASYKDAGVRTATYLTIKKGETFDVEAIYEHVGGHCVVKAANEGSSLGIYDCKTVQETENGIKEAFKFDDTVIVESFITGDEFTVAVMGGDEPFALPVIQIVAANGFYDYECKYTPGMFKHLCPAPISDELAKDLADAALAAHRALGCYGLSRTDFIVDEEGKPWALETNTLPGMTKTSLLPDAAAAMGMSFAEVCTNLVKYALERAGRL